MMPMEVFVNVGKAGSDVAAMAEALGRTISTTLRLRGSLTPRERAKEIATQLAGIGGRRSVGFGPNRIRSLPDAISFALSTHYGFKLNGDAKMHNAINGEAGAVMVAQSPAQGQPPNGGLKVDPVAAPASTNGIDEVKIKTNGKVEENQINLAEGSSDPQVYLPSGQPAGDICPSCGASSLVYEEGCAKCYSCGHAEC
jgi:ribonucleoside-diphosphate reductase alpha chain